LLSQKPKAKTTAVFAALIMVLGMSAGGACGSGPVSPSGAHATGLVVTHTTGFRHSSIDVAEPTLAELGRNNNFDVVFARNATDVAQLLTADGLSRVNAVFFANTTGDLGFPDLDAFFAWVKAGGGVLGTHSATDTYHNEPRYIDMIGAEFQTHGSQTQADMDVENRNHPATSSLGSRWLVFDEIYHFTTNNRGRVDMLLALDRQPADGLPGASQLKDMPIAWTKTYGSGRIFYTALGHRDELWRDTKFQQHLRGAINWVLKR
jgi:hypothetical protein